MSMPTPKGGPRPGGRSARVQAAVHDAARGLAAELGRAAVTVPMIATRAGVTPSTIYRRWGDLGELFADVAVERLRPESEPLDTGTLEGDLLAWAEQYREEMSSAIGVAMLRDVLAARAGEPGAGSLPVPCRCTEFTAAQVQAILDRALARGEAVPAAMDVIDQVVAPVVFHALFGAAPLPAARLRERVAAVLAGVPAGVAQPA